MRVLRFGVEAQLLPLVERLSEEDVVGRRLLGGLGDELLADGDGDFFVGGNSGQLEPVADRELDDAIGRRHARRLVHVKPLDDRRVRGPALLVGRGELGPVLPPPPPPGLPPFLPPALHPPKLLPPPPLAHLRPPPPRPN